MKKRVLSILLAMLMVISLMPTTALAYDTTPTFTVTVTNGDGSVCYSSWADTLNKVTDLCRQSYEVTVTMGADYNTAEGTPLDCGHQLFTLDLNSHTLGGSVKNAQNVTVVDDNTTKGTLAATGTYKNIGQGLVAEEYVISNGNSNTTITLAEKGKYYTVKYCVTDPADSQNCKTYIVPVLAGAKTTLWDAENLATSFSGYRLSKWIVASTYDLSEGTGETAGGEETDPITTGVYPENYGAALGPGTEYTVNSDVMLMANFEKTSYTVTYYSELEENGEDDVITTQTAKYGDTIELPGSGVYDLLSADFLGWLCLNNNVLYDAQSEFTVTNETVFVAIFASDQLYKVTYALNGGTYIPTGETTLSEEPIVEYKKAGSNVAVKSGNDFTSLSRNGYTFKGWSYDEKIYNATESSDGGQTFIMPDHDVTLTAVWEPVKTYTVSYDLNGGTYTTSGSNVSKNEIDAKAYAQGQTVVVSAVDLKLEGGNLPQYATAEFLGWKNSVDKKTYKGGQEFTMPGAAVILEAQFAIKYNVNFDLGLKGSAQYRENNTNVNYAAYLSSGGADATSTVLTAQEVSIGSTVKNPGAPESYVVKDTDGSFTTYYFAGWKVNGDEKNIWNFSKALATTDLKDGKLTLTALWSTEKHYTVVFKDKITDMYKTGTAAEKEAAAEEAQYVLYGNKQLYTYYSDSAYNDEASALTLTAVSENTQIGTGSGTSGANQYPVFKRVDYTLGESDTTKEHDWYVKDSESGSNWFYYDVTKTLKKNFEDNEANIDSYADENGVITLWANWNYNYAPNTDGSYKVKIDTTTLDNATYAEYYSDYIEATTDPANVAGRDEEHIYRNFFLTDSFGNSYTSPDHSVSTLPDGLYLNKLTGEIYGVPKETGTFTFYVKMESDANVKATEIESAQQISDVKQITITINALPISVDRLDGNTYIYGKTYGNADTTACATSNANQGKTYVSGNLTVKLGNTNLVYMTKRAVDNGKANVTLTTNGDNNTATLAFAYDSAKTARGNRIITGTTSLSGDAWLECVGIKAVESDPAFTTFTDTITFPVVRTQGEDAGEYKLYLTEDSVKYTHDAKEENVTADNSVYKLTIPDGFASTEVTGAADKYVFTINKRPITFTANSSYTYGDLKPGDVLTGTYSNKGLANNASIGVVDNAVAAVTSTSTSNAGYLNKGSYNADYISFAITNGKWVDGEENATASKDTTANYDITSASLSVAQKTSALTVTGNEVKVLKGTTPTEANIAALATLSGVLTNDGKKDGVTLKVTKYTATVNSASSDYSTADDLINAIKDNGGLTANLTVTMTCDIDGTDKANYTLTNTSATGTLEAYTPSYSGGGGGGYIAPVVPTTDSTTDNVVNKTENKTATTTATVTPTTTTVSGVKTTTATVSGTTGTAIVEKAIANKSSEVVINAATGTSLKEATPGTATEIAIPAATISQLVEKTGASVTFKSDVANVALDRTAVEEIAKVAGTTGNVKLLINVIAQEANKVQVELKIETANGTVSDFNGGNVKVTVKLGAALAAKDLVCVYIDDNGVYHKVEGTKNADGTYTFTTGHFSSYAVMAAEDADKVIAEQAAKATELTKDLSLKARSVKTAKGNIKVTLKVDSDAIKVIEDLGYTVKYKFYRSTKKASSYKAKLEGTGKTYTNTTGTKGTRYYYKARVMVYDAEGALLAKSALTQCKYACRIK